MAPTGATGRRQPEPLSEAEAEAIASRKRAAARAAAELVEDGMLVGLGTGSTVSYLLPALAARGLKKLRCAATSPATDIAARALGLAVEDLDALHELDIAIDGADQVDPAGWLVKGGGGALTREKVVAAAARRFVVIVSAEKEVAELSAPVPLELLRFGVRHTLAAVAPAALRDVPVSPDGGLIADYLGVVPGDPRTLARRLDATPGVVEHGLFPPEMVSLILVGGDDGVRRREDAAEPP
ncbi:MAG TPA: ribose 5-phosphate isomerase A [Solirubrobacteraceae bacterium]|nr:ribose 5-phosphate isomerase A [Solirubrobacteraceae bacterium]